MCLLEPAPAESTCLVQSCVPNTQQSNITYGGPSIFSWSWRLIVSTANFARGILLLQESGPNPCSLSPSFIFPPLTFSQMYKGIIFMVITPSGLVLSHFFFLLQLLWACDYHAWDRDGAGRRVGVGGWHISCSWKRIYHDAPARSLIGSMIRNLLSVALQGALGWACDIPFLRGF